MNNNVHTGHSRGYARSELNSMLNEVPIVTRWIIGTIVVQTVITRLGYLPYEKTLYHFILATKRFQIWRSFTACFILPARSLPALFDLYTIYSRSTDLEQRRNTMDYTFYLWFCVSMLALLSSLAFGTRTLVNLETSFTFILSYTWSVDNANTRVVYFGLFPILAKYIPLMELFLAFLFNEDFAGPFMGLIVAYMFQCLDTRSFGPIYGSIFHIHGYGFSPIGQFGMPRLIKDLFAKRPTSKKSYMTHGEGRKLGSSFSPSTETTPITFSHADNDAGSGLGSTSSSPHHPTATSTIHRGFPGKGRRLGD